VRAPHFGCFFTLGLLLCLPRRDLILDHLSRRDAIIQSNNLSPEQFRPVKSAKTIGATIEILYTVHHNGQSLGYIRFSGKNGEGIVDITNRHARLELEHLDFGPTDKQNKAHLAGEHGDGLKVAILVYMRSPQSHIVKFQASGVNWNFNWRKRSGKLGMNLSRLDTKGQGKLRGESEKAFVNGLVPFAADPCKDVQILIGTSGKANDEHGAFVKR
jgi:hypothetical protein